MAGPIDERTAGRLERVAPRARKLLGLTDSSSASAESALEGTRGRKGPPDETDQRFLADRIRMEMASRPATDRLAGPEPHPLAEKIAANLVARARAALDDLTLGDGILADDAAVALEAVLTARGRPALNVEGDRIEAIDRVKHPNSGFWRTFVDNHEDNMVLAAGATGAVVARDLQGGRGSWVAGTAWLVKPDLVITNRHVVFPTPSEGPSLASRAAGTGTAAHLTAGFELTLDFAFDDGPARNVRYAALDVPFVAADGDPVDAALIRVGAVPATAPAPLPMARASLASRYLYVVGHPGEIDTMALDSDEQAVFGRPNGRKRVSLGQVMTADPAFPNDIIHDSSTIGGYSGACVLGFDVCEVVALHYYGTPVTGNRAITAQALRAHPIAALL